MKLLLRLLVVAAAAPLLGACGDNTGEPISLGSSTVGTVMTPEALAAQYAADLELDKAICQNTGARGDCLAKRDAVMHEIRASAGGLEPSLLRSELFESIAGWDIAYDEWKAAGCTNSSIEPECWTLPLDGQWTEVRVQLGF
ncbi:hypothetical protein BH683_012915 [Williamsia sp. 1138]|uniref:hypothetical protein n=1 Tax=Williamsia sp. 1138 TaxID=1903117 RepID=UPI000A0FFBD4|nr:hypothetical protein [Williamsia sp. 1138]OZG28643.1 hypothetical protein BH683_012915 [Williamsia sp. 1138]